MLTTGRISDIIPPIYHDRQNDLIRFTDCLDVEVKELERQVKGITDLINVDKCPEDRLPYLAALTGCPLMGSDTVLWRRQIRNWPYILKIKGTALSLDIFLHSIDVDEHRIYTFFRDAGGNLVEEKPEGTPFKDSLGLWHNIRTHYFDLDIIYNNEHYLTWIEWYTDLTRSMNIWLTRAKPFHSELRKLDVILKRHIELPITTGAIITPGIRHDVDIDQHTHSEADLSHTVGTALLQSYAHDIAIDQPTHSATECDIVAGGATVQGIHQNARISQATESNAELSLTVGAAMLQSPTHTISLNQATHAEGDCALSSGIGLVQGVHQSARLSQPTHSETSGNIVSGAGVIQGIHHKARIIQQTHSLTASNIYTGGAVCSYVHIEIPTAA